MKSKSLILLSLIGWLPALPQNITQVEYFLDGEIITGTGHTETVTPGTDVTHTITFNTDTLAPGLHNLYFMVKDAEGMYSPLTSKVFYKPAPSPANLSTLEYFIDNEIISGNGHTETLAAGTDITHILNINTASLSPGIHNIYFRVKDAIGIYSPMTGSVFYKPAPSPANLSTVEYFIDNEIISGNGHTETLAAGTDF
ncbi:MAG: hypothetical protein FJY07_14760, partial [Bacteroidetes bacterium]|nr:hypothetical protein [Bacteroidota bacterium]